MSWNLRTVEEQSPAHQRPHPAVLCHLPSDGAQLSADIAAARGDRSQHSDVSVANVGRHRAAVIGGTRPLHQRAVVDLPSPLAAPFALGMGTAFAWSLHPGAADVPRGFDAHRGERAGCQQFLQHRPHCSVDDVPVAGRRAGNRGAHRVDACLHRHPFLAAHERPGTRIGGLSFSDLACCCRPWRWPAMSRRATRFCARPRIRIMRNHRSRIPT